MILEYMQICNQGAYAKNSHEQKLLYCIFEEIYPDARATISQQSGNGILLKTEAFANKFLV